MSVKINRITLGIASIERTIQFYNIWIGIEPYEVTKDQVLYQVDNMTLSFVLLDKLANDADVNDESEGFDGVILSRIGNSIKSVDQMLRIAEKMGGYITKRA